MEQRLIDANEVRDAILYDNTYDNDTVNYYLGVIDDAPTVEPVQWIDVEDKLPETDNYGDINVLICMDDGFIASATYDKSNGWELWADSGDVTHWMPLPSPPQQEE